MLSLSDCTCGNCHWILCAVGFDHQSGGLICHCFKVSKDLLSTKGQQFCLPCIPCHLLKEGNIMGGQPTEQLKLTIATTRTNQMNQKIEMNESAKHHEVTVI